MPFSVVAFCPPDMPVAALPLRYFRQPLKHMSLPQKRLLQSRAASLKEQAQRHSSHVSTEGLEQEACGMQQAVSKAEMSHACSASLLSMRQSPPLKCMYVAVLQGL